MVVGLWANLKENIKQELGLSQDGPTQSQSELQTNLKSVTGSKVIDVPKELLAIIADASHKEDGRREIMKHLQDCICEPAGLKEWRRVHAALVLIEDLMHNGSPMLMSEAAQGLHFDIVQRLSFLEHYCLRDQAAQKIVRSKASTTRCNLILRIQTAEDEKDCTSDTASTCSSGDSVATPSSLASVVEMDPRITGLLRDVQGDWVTRKGTKLEVAGSSVVFPTGEGASVYEQGDGKLHLKFLNSEGAYTGILYPEHRLLRWNDGDVWQKPSGWTAPEGWGATWEHVVMHGVSLPTGMPVKPDGQTILNGIVAVGHCDETDDEASDDEEDMAPMSSLRSSDELAKDSNVKAPAQSADLLDMTAPAQLSAVSLLD